MQILIVDDNPIVVRVIGQALRESGYKVSHVPSRWAAVRYIGENRVDFVITNFILNDGSGLDLLSKLRSSGGV